MHTMKTQFLVAGLLLAGSTGGVRLQGGYLGPRSLLAGPFSGNNHGLASGELIRRDDGPPSTNNATVDRTGIFQQLIDHANPALGTFPQRFWWSAKDWAGPGSPVVVFTSGICNGSWYSNYRSNKSLPGAIAQAVGGATIVYEGRFSGDSTPFTQYTTANLTSLTIQNLVADATYLAKNLQLPFEPTGKSGPDKAPWLLVSCGFGGTITAWTKALQPGTYWAHLASSASVQAFSNFYQYFDTVQTYGPPNCTADQNKVIDYMDGILQNGTQQQKQSLKDKFGFGQLAQPADMMSALTMGPGSWMGMSFGDEYNNYSRPYFDFCDYVENVWPQSGNKTPGAEGVGLERALDGYAKWSRDVLIPNFCDGAADWGGYPEWKGETNVQCFDSFNASSPWYSDRSTKNDGHGVPFSWLQCNEPLESWAGAPPVGKPTLVSRLLDRQYYLRTCALLFPPQNGVAAAVNNGKTATDFNKLTRGWDAYSDAKRILFVDGEYDPKIESTVAAKGRPGGPLASTDQVPVLTVARGNYCPDFYLEEGNFSADAKSVMAKEMAIMTGWVQDFYKEHNITRDFKY